MKGGLIAAAAVALSSPTYLQESERAVATSFKIFDRSGTTDCVTIAVRAPSSVGGSSGPHRVLFQLNLPALCALDTVRLSGDLTPDVITEFVGIACTSFEECIRPASMAVCAALDAYYDHHQTPASSATVSTGGGSRSAPIPVPQSYASRSSGLGSAGAMILGSSGAPPRTVMGGRSLNDVVAAAALAAASSLTTPAAVANASSTAVATVAAAPSDARAAPAAVDVQTPAPTLLTPNQARGAVRTLEAPLKLVMVPQGVVASVKDGIPRVAKGRRIAVAPA
jgi:hypothetical protein